MGKTKRRNKGGGGTSKSGGGSNGNGNGGGGWSHEEHNARIDAHMATLTKKCLKKGQSVSETLEKGYKRTALAHDNADKIDSKKLHLVIVKTKREVDALRERLRTWDDAEEKKRQEEEIRREEEKKRKAMEEASGIKKKKRGRLGPETWKLRGAARPAWEVYDFDTRYVDPHLEAHQKAKEKAQRIRNILTIFKGQFGRMESKEEEDGETKPLPPQPHCRRFLSLLMQLGLLNMEAKKYKAAREVFLECIDLDGITSPVTNARCRLMRMYLEANRPASARRLWERLPQTDNSSWIRYSAALIEYVSWKLLEEDGSSQQTAELYLVRAIKANIYCAYHIAYHDTFESVVEYAEEVEDAEERTLEEAIEYCASEQMGTWVGTDGAIDWMRSVLHRIRNGWSMMVDGVEEISVKDLEWSDALAKAEEEFELSRKEDMKNEYFMMRKKREDGYDNEGEEEEEEEEETPDLLMYAGMFRTAMDMLEDAGEFLSTTEDDTFDDEEEEKMEVEKDESAKATSTSKDVASNDTSSTCSSRASDSEKDDDSSDSSDNED